MKKTLLCMLITISCLTANNAMSLPTLLDSAASPELATATLLDFNDEVAGNFKTRIFDGFVTFSAGEPTSFWGLTLSDEMVTYFGTSSGNSITTEYTWKGFDIDFAEPVESFGFSLRAIDQPWTLSLYNEDNLLLNSFIVDYSVDRRGFIGAADIDGVISRVSMRSYEFVSIDDFYYKKVETGSTPVPEPSTILLLGSGLLGLGWYGRKRKKA